MTPHQVQFLAGIADNLLRKVLVGRKHVQQVPQWYGETIGFWNGNTLVAWTANVQGWTLSHSMFEFSSSLEIIEVFTPSADGKTHHRRGDVLRSRGVHAAAAHGHAVGVRHRPGRSRSEAHVRRVPGPEHDREWPGWPANPAHVPRRWVYRLLRAAVGAELGEAFRAGLAAAREVMRGHETTQGEELRKRRCRETEGLRYHCCCRGPRGVMWTGA